MNFNLKLKLLTSVTNGVTTYTASCAASAGKCTNSSTTLCCSTDDCNMSILLIFKNVYLRKFAFF